jgi:hypothetical protein
MESLNLESMKLGVSYRHEDNDKDTHSQRETQTINERNGM